MEQNQVAVSQPNGVSIYSDANAFEHAQRMCKMLSSSTLVPKEYQGNLPNTMIAYEMSVRTGMSVFMVMQNLDIIQGRPSWNSKYVIAALNSCGRFAPLQFEYKDLGVKDIPYTVTVWSGQQKSRQQASIKVRDMSCVAISRNAQGEVIRGPLVSIEMAVKEGWYTKSDSKWPNMPEVMLSYRAAKFFGNLYAPDVLMGMHSSDEILDFSEAPLNNAQPHITKGSAPIEVLNQKVNPSTVSSDPVTVQTVEAEQVAEDDEGMI